MYDAQKDFDRQSEKVEKNNEEFLSAIREFKTRINSLEENDSSNERVIELTRELRVRLSDIGIVCKVCGKLIDDFGADGEPRLCGECIDWGFNLD